MANEWIFIGCCGFFFFLLSIISLFFLVSIYNGIIVLRKNIDRSWANIDVMLKQRSDLIPNLVNTVKGYMKHEQKVFTEITRLRTALGKAVTPNEKAKPSEKISEALASIFAVSENYPKLRANENFLKLQEQLSALENQIADRREFYNNSVLLYNTRIKVLPDSIIASIMGMKENEYFTAKEEEKKNIKLDLGK